MPFNKLYEIYETAGFSRG